MMKPPRGRVVCALAVLAVIFAAAPAAATTPDDTGTIDLASDATQITGAPDTEGVSKVVALGDVDGDKTAGDYAVSSVKSGSSARVVHVVFAHADRRPALGDLVADGFEIDGVGSAAVVAPAGDVNGDHKADVLIGNRRGSLKGGKAGDGVVAVVFGKDDSRSIDSRHLGRTDGFFIAGA